MDQAQKREYLIQRLLNEDRRYGGVEVPAGAVEQKRMLRSLMNLRRPKAMDAEFLAVQDEYLRQEIETAGVTDLYSGGFYPFPSLEEYWAWWAGTSTITATT